MFPLSNLQVYDILLKLITSNITNISFGEADPAWIPATLPVRCGGLGIRSVVQLAPSSFLASAAAWSNLVYQIFTAHFLDTPIPHPPNDLAKWSYGHGLSPPHGTAQQQQRAWDTLKVSVTANLFRSWSWWKIMCTVSGGLIKGVWYMVACLQSQLM